MSCAKCKKQFFLSNVENDAKPHMCLTCGKGYSLKIQLKRHMVSHENGTFICINCENQDDRLYNLRVPKIDNTFACEKCESIFKTKRLLLRHVCKSALNDRSSSIEDLFEHCDKRKSNKPLNDDLLSYFCFDCNKSFSSSNSFDRHKITHNRFECKSCHTKFSTKEGLNTHSGAGCGQEKNTDVKKHTCHICEKSFARKSALDGHLSSHLEDKIIEESGCDDSDMDVDFILDEKDKSLKGHKEIFLPKLKIKRNFQCEICFEKYISKKMLNNHLLVHNVETQDSDEKEKNKYTCRKCNEILFSKEDYKQHKLVHYSILDKTKKKLQKYNCKKCGEKFLKKKHFKKHYKKCTGDLNKVVIRKRSKDHSCEDCGKRFFGKQWLEKHIAKFHSGENISVGRKTKKKKELICPTCDANFTGRKSAFAKHKLSHVPEVCGICDARFADRPALREHLKTHLGTEEAKKFVECSQRVQNAKNNVYPNVEPKVEYIYLVLR